LESRRFCITARPVKSHGAVTQLKVGKISVR
jgi:hypothetical protein